MYYVLHGYNVLMTRSHLFSCGSGKIVIFRLFLYNVRHNFGFLYNLRFRAGGILYSSQDILETLNSEAAPKLENRECDHWLFVMIYWHLHLHEKKQKFKLQE